MSTRIGLGFFLAVALLKSANIPPTEKYSAAERNHWSFRPRSAPAIPQFQAAEDRTWAASPIDAFILSRLKKERLTHAPKADRQTLIRRVYLDVIGLPPTPEQISAFVTDNVAGRMDEACRRTSCIA